MDSDNESITSEVPNMNTEEVADNTEELRAELLNLAKEGVIGHTPSYIKKAKKPTIRKIHELHRKEVEKYE